MITDILHMCNLGLTHQENRTWSNAMEVLESGSNFKNQIVQVENVKHCASLLFYPIILCMVPILLKGVNNCKVDCVLLVWHSMLL